MWRRRRIVERVWLADLVVEEIFAQARELAPLETGGMLLGYEGLDPAEAVIVDLVGPGPNARHNQGSFVPDGKWQQRELERIYAESGRVTTYLGDWHSHPNGAPSPSRKDRRTARRVARAAESRAPRPLTLIAASTDDQWLLSAYRLAGRSFQGLRISRLKSDGDDSTTTARTALEPTD